MDRPPSPRCSFCGKYEQQVAKLIAAPDANICDECVQVSMELITGEKAESHESRLTLDTGETITIAHALNDALHLAETHAAFVTFNLTDGTRFGTRRSAIHHIQETASKAA